MTAFGTHDILHAVNVQKFEQCHGFAVTDWQQDHWSSRIFGRSFGGPQFPFSDFLVPWHLGNTAELATFIGFGEGGHLIRGIGLRPGEARQKLAQFRDLGIFAPFSDFFLKFEWGPAWSSFFLLKNGNPLQKFGCNHHLPIDNPVGIGVCQTTPLPRRPGDSRRLAGRQECCNQPVISQSAN